MRPKTFKATTFLLFGLDVNAIDTFGPFDEAMTTLRQPTINTSSLYDTSSQLYNKTNIIGRKLKVGYRIQFHSTYNL
jgi:hypothetical protein